MNGLILQGPFLTRSEAARGAGLSASDVSHRPDLLRAGGRTYREAYFALQFDEMGIRDDIGRIVLALRGKMTDAAIADWLVRGSAALDGMSPLSWLNRGGDLGHLLALASEAAPSISKAKSDSATPPVIATARPGGRWNAASEHRRPRVRLRPPLPTSLG